MRSTDSVSVSLFLGFGGVLRYSCVPCLFLFPTAALNHHSHVEIRCKTERRDMICRPASTGNLLSETSSAGRPNDKVDAKDDDLVCRGAGKRSFWKKIMSVWGFHVSKTLYMYILLDW